VRSWCATPKRSTARRNANARDLRRVGLGDNVHFARPLTETETTVLAYSSFLHVRPGRKRKARYDNGAPFLSPQPEVIFTVIYAGVINETAVLPPYRRR
jgi:hypothetical protein